MNSIAYGQEDDIFTFCYGFDEYLIEQSFSNDLDEIIGLCNSTEIRFIKIFAYSDTIGSEIYNDELSKKRALIMWDFIDKRTDISEDQTFVTWLGESAEVYDLHFERNHAQQRCIDVVLSFKTS